MTILARAPVMNFFLRFFPVMGVFLPSLTLGSTKSQFANSPCVVHGIGSSCCIA